MRHCLDERLEVLAFCSARSITIPACILTTFELVRFSYNESLTLQHSRISKREFNTMFIASAAHILVETEEACQDLKEQIEGGLDFAAAAAEFSACPSGAQGGALGEFSPGQMVPEFDQVVFNDEVGVVHGPVKTQFGYHLIIISSREQQREASARHILVETEEACQDLKEQIEGGLDFAAAAAEFSACPSGAQGGALGSFGPGRMVPEFDKVVFNDEVGVVHGPVKTQFGFHLIEITSRDD